jgi:DNA-binding MarR family transcriptional regulator
MWLPRQQDLHELAARTEPRETRMAIAVPTRQVRFLGGTTGRLDDPHHAAELRDQQLPPTAWSAPTTAVLDISGSQPAPAALREIVLTLGQRVRGGVYGDMKIVIAVEDEAVAEVIRLLGREYDLPLFLSRSSRPEDIERSEPLGELTRGERETLDELREVGGGATVAALAGAIGIAASAANNRLTNLERKGYVYRLKRARSHGDIYVDPRASAEELLLGVTEEGDVPPPRSALLAAGIRSNPYDRSRIDLSGEAAERAAEILRRRGKVK